MADVAASGQTPPTFKLVLVGDGGTGKVSSIIFSSKKERSCAVFACEKVWCPRGY